MKDSQTHAQILVDLAQISLSGYEFRVACMTALSELEGFDWSGIYILEGQELVLDAFVGAATEHVRIPVGQGICGTAIVTGENQVVDDVWDRENYLACSLETHSEIVVLIKDNAGEILGQIDIDSHQKGRFSDVEEKFLMQLARLISERW